MKFQATEPFWKAYAQLPTRVKEKARQAFLLFQAGAQHSPFLNIGTHEIYRKP
jgi:hypothetical protein